MEQGARREGLVGVVEIEKEGMDILSGEDRQGVDGSLRLADQGMEKREKVGEEARDERSLEQRGIVLQASLHSLLRLNQFEGQIEFRALAFRLQNI